MSRLLSYLASALALTSSTTSKPVTEPQPVHRGRGFNHVEGKAFRLADGTQYRVTASGAWLRTTPRAWEAKDRKGTHNKSVRRRLRAMGIEG